MLEVYLRSRIESDHASYRGIWELRSPVLIPIVQDDMGIRMEGGVFSVDYIEVSARTGKIYAYEIVEATYKSSYDRITTRLLRMGFARRQETQ